MAELAKTFDAYVERAIDRIGRLKTPHTHGALLVFPNPGDEILSTVKGLEESSEFTELVLATQETFRDNFHSAKTQGRWMWSVQTFFKRSGFYLQAGAGLLVDSSELFSRYCETFRRRKRKVSYLAPLEFVEFAKPRLDCGSFEIRRLSQAELDQLLGTELNRVFYRYALTDTARLSNYWFLLVNEVEKTRPISTRYTLDLSAIGNAGRSYSLPPPAVEQALRVLALFDWTLATPRYDPPDGWIRFGLPLIISSSDDLLTQPRGLPDPSVLETETRLDHEGEEFEVATVHAEVEEEACDRLHDFCHRIGQALKKFPPGHPWHFFEVGMTHFVRAFLTIGLDQLLWYMTSLEALLGGGPTEPIRRTVGKRLGAILGETASEQKMIRNRFNDLYDLRCDLVHGNRLVSSIAHSDLAEMRKYARGTVLWFAQWLQAIESEHKSDTGMPLPGRSELLTALDLHQDRDRIAHLLLRLPSSFPHVRDWLE